MYKERLVKLGILCAFAFVIGTYPFSETLGEAYEKSRNNHKGSSAYFLQKQAWVSGGGRIQGSTYQVITSIGQKDAGHLTNSPNYNFEGGILAGGGQYVDVIYQDSME